MKLSAKKKTKLYSTVSDEIMRARIDIAKVLGNSIHGPEVETILSRLCYQAAQKAIDLFETKQPTNRN